MCQMYTVQEAATKLGVIPATIRNYWIPSGYIKCIRLFERPKSPIRIPKTEVERILKEKYDKLTVERDKIKAQIDSL